MKKTWIFFALMAGVALCGANYLVEAESFAFPGLWKTTSVRNASGSGMIQGGKGDEAKGTFLFPEGGTYYVWMRSYSFGGKWRRATLFVGKREAGSAGDEYDASLLKYPVFTWGKLKRPVLIQSGKVELTLRSDSANTRIDALLFTTDKNFVPPNGKDLPEDFEVTTLAPADEREFNAPLKLAVTTDKPAIAYHCHEIITFTVDPRCGKQTVTGGFLSYRLRSDDGVDESKVVPLAGKSIAIQATMKQPGFVRLTAELLDSQKRQVSFTDDHGKTTRAEFDGSAGADIDQIRSIPEPEDFDDFWAKQKERLGTVPLAPVITDRGLDEAKKFHRYSVSAPCPGIRYQGEDPAPMTGIYAIPVGAKPKSLKARLVLPGYGVGEQKPWMQGKENYINMAINAHGMEIGREPEYYAKFAVSRGNYALADGDDPANCYFNGMVLRLLRALEFLKSLPEWNGVDLEVTGGSQGGLHALWAAALDPAVTKCEARIPWCCNVGGQTLGLMKQDLVVLKYARGRDYYDPINMAKRIGCPVNITRAGLGDFTCPPSGIARMYYNLRCPKEITWVQNSSHSEDYPADAEKFNVVGNQKLQ